jgi:hypothetical protein
LEFGIFYRPIKPDYHVRSHVIEFTGPTRKHARSAIEIKEIASFFARKLLTQYDRAQACNAANRSLHFFHPD